MMTMRQFQNEPENLPTITTWSLTELAESKGKQELFTQQSPQKLRVLRENAMIESAIASNRIEGVNIDPARIDAVLRGKGALRDRDEHEVRGYQEALKWIHEDHRNIEVNVNTILKLHSLCRPDVHDAGKFKDQDGEIIEKYPDGRVRVRFKPLSARDTPAGMKELIELSVECSHYRWVPPLAAVAAFNLDFLCIHPFRDGNGRVSRLLLLLQLYHIGYEVGRYISLERTIEQNKERYYETLEECSHGWHTGKHRPWPYINFLLYVIKLSYKEFEDRLGQVIEPKGDKTMRIELAVQKKSGAFHVMEIQRACPGISLDMIRHVLKDLKRRGMIECTGRGKLATWHKIAELGNRNGNRQFIR